MHINSKSNFLAFYHVIFGIPLFGAICDASTARIGNFTCDGLVPRVRRRMAECDLADRKSREDMQLKRIRAAGGNTADGEENRRLRQIHRHGDSRV